MFGVCYYPEHWPQSQWDQDAAMMAELGLTYVRIGEFAWSRLEPNPGEYNFDWLDAAIASLTHAGLKVVMGTPTATPPKWLIDQYPEILPEVLAHVATMTFPVPTICVNHCVLPKLWPNAMATMRAWSVGKQIMSCAVMTLPLAVQPLLVMHFNTGANGVTPA